VDLFGSPLHGRRLSENDEVRPGSISTYLKDSELGGVNLSEVRNFMRKKFSRSQLLAYRANLPFG
jgi:hypothetical protein